MTTTAPSHDSLAPDTPDTQHAPPSIEYLTAQLTDLQSELSEARAALDASETRRSIDSALVAADAIDLDTARLLTELALEHMEDQDIDLAISDLKQHKPFLFRARTTSFSTTMSPHPPELRSTLEIAAERAARTGDRTSLLHYLRTRRDSA